MFLATHRNFIDLLCVCGGEEKALRQQQFIREIIEIPTHNFHLHSYAATSSRDSPLQPLMAGDNEPGTISNTYNLLIPDTTPN